MFAYCYSLPVRSGVSYKQDICIPKVVWLYVQWTAASLCSELLPWRLFMPSALRWRRERKQDGSKKGV